MQREVYLPGSESPQHVAAKVSLHPVGRIGERGGVVAFASWILRTIKIQGHAGNQVGPAKIRSVCEDVRRQRGAGEKDAVRRPVPNKNRRNPAVGGRQRSDQRPVEAVPDVEVRRSAVYVRMVILRQSFNGGVKGQLFVVTRKIVNRMRPGIREQQGKAVGQAAVKPE